MGKISRTTITRSIAATAAGLLVLALPLASAQAAPKTVNPVGTWKLTGLQIGDQAVVPCPTPTTDLNERWYCKADTMLKLKANGKYTDNIPIIQTNKGTWFSNNTNIIVFDDAGDTGSDARAYGMEIKGKTLKISRQGTFGPTSETAVAMELHMIFTKQ